MFYENYTIVLIKVFTQNILSKIQTVVNWHKFLHRAWDSSLKKKKNNGEKTLPYLESFAKNYKTRLAVIERHLQRKDYNFGKWKAVLIPKKDGGYRPLVIPNSINDKLVLKSISDYLSDSLCYVFNSVSTISYAYQKGKSTRDALIQLKRIHKPCNILLKIDIQHFFDEIDKEILIHLLNQYPIDEYVKGLIYNGINPAIDFSGFTESEIDKFPKGGIPQGNPISAILSNIYLYELDKMAISKGWKMVRYADDMAFSVSNIRDAQLILSQIEEYLSTNRKLTIHPLKTSLDAKTAIFLNPKKNRMKYLGVIFDGQNLSPTKECYNQLVGKIKTILKGSLNSNEKEVALKKTIAQWCGYYAFTDIPNSQIKWINSTINYQIGKYKLDIPKVNIADVILKTRKRQNNRLVRFFHPIQFGEEYGWLNIYD